MNHKNAFDPSYKVGTRCRNLIQDIRAYRQHRGERFGWLELLGGRDHLDFLATDDWRPQFVNLGGLVRSVLRKLMLDVNQQTVPVAPSPLRLGSCR